MNRSEIPYHMIKSTSRAILLSIHYWEPKPYNTPPKPPFETKTITFWVPLKAVNLGKVQFKYVQKEIDRLISVNKSINILAINRNIGEVRPR